jgi:anti-sigma factor RsiW
MQQPHISDDLLDLYAIGTLSTASVAELEEHLLVCEMCRERLRESDEFAGLFRQAATLPEAGPPARRPSSG